MDSGIALRFAGMTAPASDWGRRDASLLKLN
jgi:hypothetical protein